MAIRKSNYLKLGIYALLILFTVAAGMYSVSTFTSAVTGVVTGLTVSPDPIRLGSSVYIQYSISQNALITIKVYKDTGELVRTVLNNVSKPAGTFNQGWDGKNASGALVSDGYYRFVIEARDAGGALTGQAEKTQIAARFPSITGVLDTPDPFDPQAGEQSNISFTLSSDSLITVTILKGYSPVRTITSNELKLAGNHTLVWDGKNDAGIIQADAVYTYQIQANSPLVPTFMTTLKSYSTIAQNPPQITDFMISPDPFKIAASTMSIRYNLSENANVTLKVVDAVSGSVIKTILNAAARTAGYNSNAWDGTNDSGVHVPEGSYKVVISAVDNSNMSSGEQNIAFTAGYQPVISDAAFSPNPFNPFNPADPTNNIATVSYAISNNAIVKVDILNGYVPVRTLVNNQVQTAGNNSVIWDGRDDSGNIAGDGIYSFQITATSQAVPTFSSTVKGSLTVEKGPPSITEVLLSPDPFKLGTTAGLSVRYNLSESSTVSVSVYKGPAVVRNLVTGTAKNVGYNSEIWDGKDNTGNWVGEGVYTIAIRAADGSGGTGQASGSVTAGYLPEISGGGSAPEPFDPLAGNANVSFNLSREAKVTVTMLRGLMTVRTIQAGILAAGPHTIPWDGKDDNGLPVSDGPYTYQVDAVSPTVANFFSRFQGVITVESKAPELTDLSVSPYVVRIGSPATLRYTLSEPATITMQILDAASGSSVRTLPVETKNSGGYYTVSWNTNNDQNTLINSGDYIFRVVAVDNFNKTCRAEIQFQAGAVPVISGNLAMPGTIDVSTGGTATVSYSVSETSFVTVRVLDTTGAVIKTLTRYKEATGADSTVWDGTDAWGLAKNGTFTYTIDANSVIGNFRATQASGTITVMGASDSQPVNSCASCHQGYPAPSHLVSNCIGCHGDDKPIENCASCHPSQTHGPEVLSTFGCDYCHNTVYSYKIPVHPTDPPLHDSIFILNREVSCEQCHANNINTEHVGKVNSVTNTEMTCQTCHKSLDPLVLAAIVAQTTNCDSCHNSPVLQHNPVHTASVYTIDTTRSDAGTCNVCHTGKDLEALHVGRVNSATDQAMTCDTCHTSTDPLVLSAISTGLTNSCETCHIIHAPKDATAVHDTTDVFAGTTDTDCGTCHDRNVKIEHIDNGRTTSTGAAITCDTCHASASQQVTDAITANNTRCDACHTIHADITTAHTAPGYGYPAYSWNCGQCHTKVLTDEHSNRGMTCSACHDSTKALVQAAITSTATDGSNLKCSTCHTGTADGAGAIHTTLDYPHLTGIFPTAEDDDCLNCHTAQNGEFSAFKASYHVTGDLMSKASGYGTYVSPWTATGYVGCQGCHGSGTVGGTTAYNNILKKPYTYTSNSGQADMLCFVCHNRNTYGAGSSGSGSTGFSREGKNLHNIGDHKVNSVSQCTWCHTSRPHASDRPHLIVTMNEANSQGNLLTSFYHQTSGNYRKSSCGSNASACDEHDEY